MSCIQEYRLLNSVHILSILHVQRSSLARLSVGLLGSLCLPPAVSGLHVWVRLLHPGAFDQDLRRKWYDLHLQSMLFGDACTHPWTQASRRASSSSSSEGSYSHPSRTLLSATTRVTERPRACSGMGCTLAVSWLCVRCSAGAGLDSASWPSSTCQSPMPPCCSCRAPCWRPSWGISSWESHGGCLSSVLQ